MRTHQRLTFGQPVRFEVLTLDPAGEVLGRLADGKNLSLTGLYFETKATPEIQTHFKVGNVIWTAFDLPTASEEIKVQCEIRRVLDLPRKKIGFGAMFINLSSKAERAIVQYLK